MEMFDGPRTSKNKSIQGSITNTKKPIGTNYVISLGLTEEEALILCEPSLYKGLLPVGIRDVYNFINQKNFEDKFHDCIVTVQGKFTYVQRVKTEFNKEQRIKKKHIHKRYI
jgi:hypothetical protein